MLISQGVTLNSGYTIQGAPTNSDIAVSTNFTTPTIMNSGAVTSLLQPGSAAINSSGLITVVGTNGDFLSATSSNGTSWTGPDTKISGTTYVARVVWSSYHSLFLAFGISGGYPTYTTSSDGVTWSSATVASPTTINNLWAITVNNAGVFAAIMSLPGSVGPGYMISSDGSTWTTPTVLPGSTNGVYFLDATITANPAGKFVALGYNGFDSTPWYTVSADGSSWASQQMFGLFFKPRTVTWSSYHNLFVTVGDITSGLGYSTSADGSTWSTPAFITGSTYAMRMFSLTVDSAGVFVAVGQIQGTSTTPIYMTSINGTDWCVPTSFNGSTSTGFMRSVVYSTVTGKFISVGTDASYNWLYAISV